MFHQQDEMVSSYLFSFREASYPLFWISEFCLHSYLAPLKCQQNLVRRPIFSSRTVIRDSMIDPDTASRTFLSSLIISAIKAFSSSMRLAITLSSLLYTIVLYESSAFNPVRCLVKAICCAVNCVICSVSSLTSVVNTSITNRAATMAAQIMVIAAAIAP